MPDMLTLKGFDDCIVGFGEENGKQPVVVYDKVKILAKLMATEGMTDKEAQIFFDFAMLGANLGEGQPIFVTACDIDTIKQSSANAEPLIQLIN